MGVVDNTEVRFGILSGGGKRVDVGHSYRFQNFHIVTATIADAVGADAVVILSGRFETGDAHSHHFVIHIGDAKSAAFHFHGIAEVGH